MDLSWRSACKGPRSSIPAICLHVWGSAMHNYKVSRIESSQSRKLMHGVIIDESVGWVSSSKGRSDKDEVS